MALPDDDQRRHDVRKKLTNVAILERELGGIHYRLTKLEQSGTLAARERKEQKDLLAQRDGLIAAIDLERSRTP